MSNQYDITIEDLGCGITSISCDELDEDIYYHVQKVENGKFSVKMYENGVWDEEMVELFESFDRAAEMAIICLNIMMDGQEYAKRSNH
ncbi:hypothetical protein KEU06_15500 [Pseudaminobacter sp. 19-2017]|uniref:Uncharacterized protein n=1 Tax=Pseudaminobacter soli (ex Zhang et al. 2022) TaxID=2831468 RepID=A0A942E2M2_9HYPH|nr:hypothetical protein [Pseudaminobacter soli]MBS3650018.1 hypothetical protein [Pseudaminobacter soli]